MDGHLYFSPSLEWDNYVAHASKVFSPRVAVDMIRQAWLLHNLMGRLHPCTEKELEDCLVELVASRIASECPE